MGFKCLKVGYSGNSSFQNAWSSTLMLATESRGVRGEFCALSFQGMDRIKCPFSPRAHFGELFLLLG